MRNKRYSVSLTEEQEVAARKLLKDYLQPDMSSLFSVLIMQAYRDSLPKKRKGEESGIPDDRTASIYPHPCGDGSLLNYNELEAYYELIGQKMPSGLQR